MNAPSSRRPDAQVYSQACSLFVALAEEGWIQGPLVNSVVKEYLYPLLREKKREGLDCLVLGCTHFPLLKDAIAHVAGPDVKLVDSGETVAEAAAEMLGAANSPAVRQGRRPLPGHRRRSALRAGGKPVPRRDDQPADVEIVDL